MVKLHAPTQNVLVYGTDGEKALAEGFGRPLHTHCTWCVTYTGRITSLQNWLSWGYQQALLQNIEWQFSVKNIGSKQTAWVDWFLISWGVWWKNAVIDQNVDGTSSSRPTVPVLFPELQAGPIKQTMTASIPWQDGKLVHCKYLPLSHTKPYKSFLRLCMGQREVLTVH